MASYPSNSVTETLITAITALDGPPPSSFGLGELLRDFDNALEAFVAGGGGGGGGGGTVRAFTVNFGPSLATGVPFFTPTNGTWQKTMWVAIPTAYTGLTPQMDVGFFTGGGTEGTFVSLGMQPTKLWIADQGVPGNTLMLYNPQSASIDSGLQTLGLTFGPPALRTQMHYANSGGQQLSVVVSQDGTTNAPTPATLTAAVAPVPPGGSFPYVVTFNSNDNFNYNGVSPTGGGGARVTEKFTFVTGGTTASFADINALAAGMAAATGTSSDTFGQYVQCTSNGTEIVCTANPPSATAGNFPGFASNGNVLSAGNHDALAGLGFTGVNVFGGGLGGDPGANAGQAVILLDIATPS